MLNLRNERDKVSLRTSAKRESEYSPSRDEAELSFIETALDGATGAI